MAEDDIYGSKRKYELLVENLKYFALPPEKRNIENKSLYRAKYWCKNKANLKYFRQLFDIFEAEDQSFARRCRLIGSLRLVCFVARKDLKDCDRPDINQIMVYMRRAYKPRTQSDFVIDLKHMWKKLLPDLDERGRIDDTIMPYVVRHLSSKIDRSRQKRRQDKLSVAEFESLVAYFSGNLMMQAYVTFAVESLGRPQEMLYRRMRDVEIHDNYAKIWISDHGKEGVGFLQCIDSYPYLVKWLNEHPFKKDKNAFLFMSQGKKNFGGQLVPKILNVYLKKACKALGIDKNITGYSLKRNGVTFARLRGDKDVEIQHRARWTSTKYLKIYDQSEQEEALKSELNKRGLTSSDDDQYEKLQRVKECHFCKTKHGMTEDICGTCLRPLERRKFLDEENQKDKQISELRESLTDMQKKFDFLLEKIGGDALNLIDKKLEA